MPTNELQTAPSKLHSEAENRQAENRLLTFSYKFEKLTMVVSLSAGQGSFI